VQEIEPRSHEDTKGNASPTGRHRNNAAEWVMYAALYPVYLMVLLFTFVSSWLRGSNRSSRHT
jgi:hypothetical protein